LVAAVVARVAVVVAAAAVAAGTRLGDELHAEALAGRPRQGGVGHVPGRLGERHALVGAAELFAVGPGVVGAQFQRVGQADAAGHFHAVDPGLVDVHLLRVAAVAQQLVVAQVHAGTRAAGGFARGDGLAVVDLVAEVVAEPGDVEVVAATVRFPVQRDFGVDAGFGLQVRIADEGHGALAAETGDAVVRGRGRRRLVPGAHATLDGPASAQFARRIRARAQGAAEQVVVVVAQADGDGQCFARAPVVLGEQRPGPVHLHRAVAGPAAFHAEHAVLQLAVDGLAADD